MKITFRTAIQATLWEREIVGQLSDGHWENSIPRDHCRPWCSAEVCVGENIGVDFYAQRSTYNLCNKSLLEVVGKRMLAYAKICKFFGRDNVGSLENLLDLDGNFRGLPKYEGKYWDEIREKLNTFGPGTIEAVRQVVDADSYSMKDLRRDLKEMTQTMRTHRKQETTTEITK